MKSRVIFGIVTLMCMMACAVEPSPIVIGEDACAHCKMTMMDQRFGAEIITSKGKIYKFDDVNCMQLFIKEQLGDQQAERLYVVDFSMEQSFIDATTATFVMNSELRTPMASHMAAFVSETAAGPFMEEYPGSEVLSWGDISEEYN